MSTVGASARAARRSPTTSGLPSPIWTSSTAPPARSTCAAAHSAASRRSAGSPPPVEIDGMRSQSISWSRRSGTGGSGLTTDPAGPVAGGALVLSVGHGRREPEGDAPDPCRLHPAQRALAELDREALLAGGSQSHPHRPDGPALTEVQTLRLLARDGELRRARARGVAADREADAALAPGAREHDPRSQRVGRGAGGGRLGRHGDRLSGRAGLAVVVVHRDGGAERTGTRIREGLPRV